MYVSERGGGTLGTTSRASFRRNTRCLHCRDPANLPDQWQHFKCLRPHPSWWQNNSNVSRLKVYPHILPDDKIILMYHGRTVFGLHILGTVKKYCILSNTIIPAKNLVECSLRTIPSGSNMCFYKTLDTLTYWRACGKLELGPALYQRTGWVPEIWTSHDVKRETATKKCVYKEESHMLYEQKLMK